MKTRNGFVSNSSSSSFIVGFPRQVFYDFGKFGNTEDICQSSLTDYLWPEKCDARKNGIVTEYDENNENAVKDLYMVARIVMFAVQGKKPLSRKEIAEKIAVGYFSGLPDYSKTHVESQKFEDDYCKQHDQSIWNLPDTDPAKKKFKKIMAKEDRAHAKATKVAARVLLEKMWPKLKSMKVFDIEFSDGDGRMFATLEHGNTFDEVPHIKISHH